MIDQGTCILTMIIRSKQRQVYGGVEIVCVFVFLIKNFHCSFLCFGYLSVCVCGYIGIYSEHNFNI